MPKIEPIDRGIQAKIKNQPNILKLYKRPGEFI